LRGEEEPAALGGGDRGAGGVGEEVAPALLTCAVAGGLKWGEKERQPVAGGFGED